MLTLRQQAILKAVVEHYIAAAQPVPSEVLVREHGLGVSSATVRNDMVELEAEGYLYQPHTSAGRLPSDRGYRYFIEHLMEEREISPSEQLTVRHQFHQIALVREQWLQLAANLLARAVPAAAIVSAPQSLQCGVKHFEVLQIQDQLGLLVLVLQDGTVKQQLLQLPGDTMQADLSEATSRLNALFHNATRTDIAAAKHAYTYVEQFVVSSLLELMGQIDTVAGTELFRDGLIQLLDQPEFAQSQRALPLVSELERPRMLRELVGALGASSGVTVLIGSEHSWDWLEGCSLVFANYGIEGDLSGVVGVVGPTRMRYFVAVPTVRFLASLLSELLAELVGGERTATFGAHSGGSGATVST